jgi:hypothetical protein
LLSSPTANTPRLAARQVSGVSEVPVEIDVASGRAASASPIGLEERAPSAPQVSRDRETLSCSSPDAT